MELCCATNRINFERKEMQCYAFVSQNCRYKSNMYERTPLPFYDIVNEWDIMYSGN